MRNLYHLSIVCNVVSLKFKKMNPSAINPAVKPLAWLIGTWKSVSAKGYYPTIKSFTYKEVLTFKSMGQPLLNYNSLTFTDDDEVKPPSCENSPDPMHLEAGFLRIQPDTNNVAFLVSMNLGVAEVCEGTVENRVLTLSSTHVESMSFVKHPKVMAIKREYCLNTDGKLNYFLSMETCTTPMTPHLEVVYEKEKEKVRDC